MSYIKNDGYFIYLKRAYINDVTGSRNIHFEKMSEAYIIEKGKSEKWLLSFVLKNLIKQLDERMQELAKKFNVEPRKLLSHVLEYKLTWD